MLRITESRSAADDVTLALQGRVAGPWIDELARTASSRMDARSLTLDLADVTFLDRDALPVFQMLAANGVRVKGCSAFVRTLLHDLCRNSSVPKEI